MFKKKNKKKGKHEMAYGYDKIFKKISLVPCYALVMGIYL